MTLPTLGWLCETLRASPCALDPQTPLGPISIDTRTLGAGDVFWALRARRDGHDFVAQAFAGGAKAAVVNERWKQSEAAAPFRERLIGVRDTGSDLQCAARAWREALSCFVIGITGTNGKTSTKDLVRRLLTLRMRTAGTEGNLNNEIGVPLTLLTISRRDEAAVIEMGASHRGDIRFLCEICQPTHGLVTSIGKAHLEGFGSVKAVAETKGELYDFVAASGLAFVPVSDEWCVAESSGCRRRVGYAFGSAPSDWDGEFHSGTGPVFDAEGCARFGFEGTEIRLNVPGRPAALTALAALTVAAHFGVPAPECRDVISRWKGVDGRASVRRLGSILLMDDSYNANPVSMRAALDTLAMIAGRRRVAVLGDMNELGDDAEQEHRELATHVSRAGIGCVVFIGRFAELCAAETAGVEAHAFTDAQALEGEIGALVRDGDVVLVKGSRSVHLERIVDALTKRYS